MSVAGESKNDVTARLSRSQLLPHYNLRGVILRFKWYVAAVVLKRDLIQVASSDPRVTHLFRDRACVA